MALKIFQEHPAQKSAHEREAPELQPDPFKRIAVRMLRRQDVEGQIQKVHRQGPQTDWQDDFKISLRLRRQEHEKRQQEMAEDEEQAYPPPGTVFADEVPEGLAGRVRVPDDKV